jgi:hypothetical protein
MTPPELLDRGLNFVNKDTDVLWEPFVGDGSSTEYLRSKGFTVINGNDPDYFKQKKPTVPEGKRLVFFSNPPFSKKHQLLKSLLQHEIDDFILLLPLGSLFTIKFDDFRDKLPDTGLHVDLLTKVGFIVDGKQASKNGPFSFAWFVFSKFHRIVRVFDSHRSISMSTNVSIKNYKPRAPSKTTSCNTFLPPLTLFHTLSRVYTSEKTTVEFKGLEDPGKHENRRRNAEIILRSATNDSVTRQLKCYFIQNHKRRFYDEIKSAVESNKENKVPVALLMPITSACTKRFKYHIQPAKWTETITCERPKLIRESTMKEMPTRTPFGFAWLILEF